MLSIYRYCCVAFTLFLTFAGYAQEFFPNVETASNVPKSVLAAGINNEIYKDISQLRLWQGYTYTYGLSAQLSLSGTFSFSNHHDYYLPGNFIINSSAGLYTRGYVNGLKYPFSFENYGMELKWRFLSREGEKKHFRMAAYTQLAGGNEPHLSAEPNLNGDNAGASLGMVATLLQNKFAASLASGIILPYRYINSADSVSIRYGNAFTYNLSFGYLLLPARYFNYKQLGINVFIEFTGEAYNAANVLKNNAMVNTADAPSLVKGNYFEASPAVQFIILSNTRVDVSLACLILGHSYERGYPVVNFAVQHSFYL